jgi:thymidine kinase
MARLQSTRRAHRNVLVVKPALVEQIRPDVIGVDEAQFFPGDFSGALAAIARDLDVYVAGLDLDAWARPFGPMPQLLAVADRVEKFTANCFQCGQDARFTQKIGGSAGRIEVGADDLYEARCGACWTSPPAWSIAGRVSGRPAMPPRRRRPAPAAPPGGRAGTRCRAS